MQEEALGLIETRGWVAMVEASDAMVKALSDEMVRKISAKGSPPFDLARASHRKEHLDDIDRALRA